MKIKLSKTKWEEMGKQAGWMKIAQEMTGISGPRTTNMTLDVSQAIKLCDDIKKSLMGGDIQKAISILPLLSRQLSYKYNDDPSCEDCPGSSNFKYDVIE